MSLCGVGETLINAKCVEERTALIMNFWESLYTAKIEGNKKGKTGFVQDLLTLFLPLLQLQPFIKEEKVCKFCNFKEENKIRWPLPIRIHDLGNLMYNSIQKQFDWFIGKRTPEKCEVCFQDCLETQIKINNEPNFVLIEFIPSLAYDQGKIEYNQILINNNSKSQYQLIATINRPSPVHFNCAIYEPKKKNYRRIFDERMVYS